MTLAVILLQQQIPRVRLRFISGLFYLFWEGFDTEMTVPSNMELAELHGGLFSYYACALEGTVLVLWRSTKHS